MAVHEDRMARNPSTVVSRIKRMEIPSTPTWYCTPMDGIQGMLFSNWNGAPSGRYRQKSGSETSIPRKATPVAYQAIAFFDSELKKRRPRAPTRGRKVMVVRIH